MTTKFIIFIVLIIFVFNNIQFTENFTDENQTKKDINKQKNNLNIIIPLRDREKDLEAYLQNMIPILEEQKINYQIFIIEQSHQQKLFNKAKINNIGFLEASKSNNFSRFLFNDVDNYPIQKDFIDFKLPIKGVHHFFGQTYCIGGIYLFSKNDFQKINGFSNDFFGWGGEDEDLLFRINNSGLKILRDIFVSRNDNIKLKIISDDSTMWKHRNRNPNLKKILDNKKKLYSKDKNNIQKDGINTCSYKIVKVDNKYKNNPNVKRILVDI